MIYVKLNDWIWLYFGLSAFTDVMCEG